MKPFTSILCGVEGHPSSSEAVRQAIALATDGAGLHFLAVDASFELGEESRREALEESLERAAQLARDAGITASTEIREGRYAIDVLLPAAESHDLLVIGTRDQSRAAGIVFGSTTSEAAHKTERPLLIARKPPDPIEFPSHILLASDGSPGSWAPTRTAAAIAAAFGSTLEIVHVVDGMHPERRRLLDDQMAEIRGLTGEEPPVAEPTGHAKAAIIEAAAESGSSLIVCGRRGLHGVKALGSVSERVAHGASCSVLIVPPDDHQEQLDS